MFKFSLSIYALAMIGGQLQADLVSAELPSIKDIPSDLQAIADEPRPEAELLMPNAIPDVERVHVNQTSIQSRGVDGSRFGAYLERVDLRKCQHFQEYLPNFYMGMVVNSRAWMTKKGEERFTSMALMTTYNDIVSSTSGAWPSEKRKIFHTWEQIQFDPSYPNITKNDPGTVRIQSWNSGQQIYIPIYMADWAIGKAYMLHIYPEPRTLAYPDDSSYEDGLLWATGSDFNLLYRFDINIAELIRNLDNFSVPNYHEFIKPLGVVKTNSSGYQKNVVYLDSRSQNLHGPSQSSATEYICQDSLKSVDLTWSQMKTILAQQFRWF